MSGLLTPIALAALLLVVGGPVAAGAVNQADPRATAATAIVAPPGSLATMLRHLPALNLGGEAHGIVIYTNLAKQLAVAGVAPPAPGSEVGREWTRAVFWLAMPTHVTEMNRPEWRQTFGFGLAEIDQAIEYAAPPFYLTILRGRFDRDELIRSWTNEGYRAVEVDGATIYTVRDDFEHDPRSASGRLAFSSMNHAAFLDANTIAFAGVRAALTSAIAAAAGAEPSMPDDVGIAPLLPHLPPDLVSALIVAGTDLAWSDDQAGELVEGAADDDAIATAIAGERSEARRMPPIVAAVLGQTAGGPLGDLVGPSAERPVAPPIPAAEIVVGLTMVHHAAAETAAAVVARRLATMRYPIGAAADETSPPTYAALFPQSAIRAAAGEPVVIVELTPRPDISPGALIRLFGLQRLTLLAWAR